jgi:DNA (cytosine-5)-methyltransferase 1
VKRRPLLFDGCCGAGLAADGWVAAGYDVVGCDVNEQPNYPYAFMRGDILNVLSWQGGTWLEPFDVLAISPPCQDRTRAGTLRTAQGGASKYPDLLTPVLDLLRKWWNHKPWVVENVENVKDHKMDPQEGEYLVRLCGSAFEPRMVQRHRMFLSNRPLVGVDCDHSVFPIYEPTGKPKPWGIYHVPNDDLARAHREGRAKGSGGRTCLTKEHGAECMGLDRILPWNELKEGYQPAYSQFIGQQLMALEKAAAA